MEDENLMIAAIKSAGFESLLPVEPDALGPNASLNDSVVYNRNLGAYRKALQDLYWYCENQKKVNQANDLASKRAAKEFTSSSKPDSDSDYVP